jgi:two-component system KDP operon response regulator KdpE
MSGPRVLVVDDEAATCRLLHAVLSEQGYTVQTAASGAEALHRAAHTRPDVIVLDFLLPDLDGRALCAALREWCQAPILVISELAEEQTKVEALDHGADDYLTKPFGLAEFLARVRAALRRVPGAAPAPVLESGELRLDQVRRRVTRRGHEVHLTPTEYELLRYLMTHADRVVTHRLLLHAVWGASYKDATATLRVFMAQLRRKIEPNPKAPRYIQTVPRIGYCFVSA